MKLLFDQNLSHKLVDRLREEFPDSRHVRDIGLASADDATIVQFALAQGFTIVSKDADFLALRFVLGETRSNGLDQTGKRVEQSGRAGVAGATSVYRGACQRSLAGH